jgi:hypothetical protein
MKDGGGIGDAFGQVAFFCAVVLAAVGLLGFLKLLFFG